MKKTYNRLSSIVFLGIFLAANASAKGSDIGSWWMRNQVNVSLVISLVALIVSLNLLLKNKRRHK